MNIGNDAVELYVSKVKPLVYQRIFRSVMAYISGSGESYQSITQRVNTIADSKTRFALMAVLAKNASIISEAEANQAINAAPSRQMMHVLRAILAGSGAAASPAFTVTLDNLVNLTGGGTANVFMTGSSGGNGVITAKASASRLTGVAPLYVNIDMTDTTSTLSTNPSHELFYSINWGDSGAGQWANGVQSAGLTDKNWSFGPVGGHLFETPGTYVVTPTATDGVNTANRTKTIVVLDPNVVYNPAYGAGYETICISHSGNFTGAPGVSGLPGVATYVNTAGNADMYAAFNTYKASNKRILFNKADSWTCSAQMAFSNLTNMTVGGYGTGVAASFGAGTMVSVSSSYNGSLIYPGAGNTDIKFCNLKIAASKDTQAIWLYSTITQFLAYKVEIRGCQQGFNAFPGTAGANNVFDQHCMYECLVDDLYGYAFVDMPTASASGAIGTPGVFTAAAHPFGVGYKVRLIGTPPAPLAVLTDYYISTANLSASTFSLSSSAANAAAGVSLALSGAGTCTVTAQQLGGGVPAFVGFVRGGMMGCYFDNHNNGEQTVRLPYLDRAHINNNYMARPNQGKNILKIHSFVYAQVPLYTEKFVVSGNVLSLRGGYSYNTVIPNNGATASVVGDPSIIISNGGASGYEKTRNAIVENNITYGCLGNPKNAQSFIGVGGPHMTVRNNIADFSVDDRSSSYSGPDSFTAIQMASVTTSTDDPTIGVRIYNNTLYSNLYNAEVACFVSVTQPTSVTATGAVGTPGVFTSTLSHYMTSGSKLRLAGAPPAPLAAGVDYWVTPTNLTAATFTISATNGGAALAISGAGTCLVYRGPEVDDLIVKNNLWYLPNHNPANTRIAAVWLSGTPAAAPTNVVTSNNTDNVQNARVSPNFAVQPPALLTDWRPNAGSYAINTGATVPVLRDFNSANRYGGAYDLGAVLP